MSVFADVIFPWKGNILSNDICKLDLGISQIFEFNERLHLLLFTRQKAMSDLKVFCTLLAYQSSVAVLASCNIQAEIISRALNVDKLARLVITKTVFLKYAQLWLLSDFVPNSSRVGFWWLQNELPKALGLETYKYFLQSQTLT